MSESKKKRQHYVPKLYLRHFSFDDGKRLHLIRVDKLSSILGIGLKSQCYDDYFYGKDLKVENALQDIEGITAKIFRRIIENRSLPEAGTPDDFILRTFVCLQWGRTKSHAEMSEAIFDKMLKTAYASEWRAQGITQKQIDEVHFGTDYPGSFSLGMVSDMVPFLGDLESKLIVTGGNGEFVTSDAPVALFNPYLLDRFPGGVTGLNVRGLVIFFPISPGLLVVLYDRTCYRVGSRNARVVSLSCRSDLVALNNFQFLHADDAVYFYDEKLADEYMLEFSKVARMRHKDRSVVREMHSTMPGDNSSLLVSHQAEFSYRPPFSFLSLLRKRRGKTDPVDQIEERNTNISTLFDQYQSEVKAGLSKHGFLDYYTAHYHDKKGAFL